MAHAVDNSRAQMQVPQQHPSMCCMALNHLLFRPHDKAASHKLQPQAMWQGKHKRQGIAVIETQPLRQHGHDTPAAPRPGHWQIAGLDLHWQYVILHTQQGLAGDLAPRHSTHTTHHNTSRHTLRDHTLQTHANCNSHPSKHVCCSCLREIPNLPTYTAHLIRRSNAVHTWNTTPTVRRCSGLQLCSLLRVYRALRVTCQSHQAPDWHIRDKTADAASAICRSQEHVR